MSVVDMLKVVYVRLGIEAWAVIERRNTLPDSARKWDVEMRQVATDMSEKDEISHIPLNLYEKTNARPSHTGGPTLTGFTL
jgi:hypothetical protein